MADRPEPTYAHPTQIQGSRPSVESERHQFPSYNIHDQPQDKSSDEEGTVVGDHSNEKLKENARPRSASHLTVETQYEHGDPLKSVNSPSFNREQQYRVDDDLEMLKMERQISKANEEAFTRSKTRGGGGNDDAGPGGLYRNRSRRREEMEDDFDVATNPVHEKTQVYKPMESPASGFGKFIRSVHQSNFLIRWATYIAPLTLILLIPLLIGALVPGLEEANVGGVYLEWFMIWLVIVWLSLWAGRMLAKALPWPIGVVSSLFTNNSKKWRDMGKQLELPATLFFWWLAIEVSFLPTMRNHKIPERDSAGRLVRDQNDVVQRQDISGWTKPRNKVLISLFVGVILNFVEKIIIQLIAISFHLRTYADRIEINKFQIGSLAKLYKFSKEKIAMEDSEFEQPSTEPGSGARTPGQFFGEAAQTTKQAINKFGDVAGKVAGDFTGKQTMKSTHPHQVVLGLLHSTSGSQVLARRLYRTFGRPDSETVVSDDLRAAFENDEEADAAFSMFDKDLNGDISMEELEAVCVEIGRERKAITASLKDLDSVVARLDDVFMFIVFVITVLVFISLISTSAAGVLSSAGSAVLALSWLFSATAQEFLQSVIFVFVKHPFDVGDRVQIYGNTGAMGMGDDYFVKEIALLYTEFKKMEGHLVQAPNSYLNTLFILNQRRSGGLAEAVPIVIKFGTTLNQIDGLRQKLLDFVLAEKREYQGKILTELRSVDEVHSMTLNIVFFYKSNWQNEGLRLARRNKFISALMVCMQEMNIEGPRMRYPGQKQSFPMYLQNMPHVQVPGIGHSGHPDQPGGMIMDEPEPGQDPPFVEPLPAGQEQNNGGPPPYTRNTRTGSIMKGSRHRGESLSAMNKRVDFSLGARAAASMDSSDDVFESRDRSRIPLNVTEASRERDRSEELRRSVERAASHDRHGLGRSTSRDDGPGVPGMLNRRSTDSGSRWRTGTHRNRFFGRGARPGTGDEHLMESGQSQMADIPENPPATHGSDGTQATQGLGHNNERLDPRSGMVSPAAWRMNTQESNLRPSGSPAPQLGEVDVGAPEGHAKIGTGRSQTEDFEMRRMRG